ncbi:MAG TPA: phosphodiester glycosidase family protein [Candidatus Limiplasma sp.]|nr:phosphodiester glycosidase family protein [Candidatus Limiplasma sp.]
MFAFGPILVQNGEMGERIQDPTYYHYREPRCALGMIEPNHYMVLTVSGRTDTSKGAYLTWLAERMIFLGVTEALNLDGGGTTSLVFMGERVYADCSGTTSVRDVSSIIGFGQYTQAGQ